jgi:hypothetical protein
VPAAAVVGDGVSNGLPGILPEGPIWETLGAAGLVLGPSGKTQVRKQESYRSKFGAIRLFEPALF